MSSVIPDPREASRSPREEGQGALGRVPTLRGGWGLRLGQLLVSSLWALLWRSEATKSLRGVA